MNLLEYVTREKLVNFVKENSDIDLEPAGVPGHEGWYVDKGLPVSISVHEFNFMRDFIIRHHLRNGFELGTGNGISTIAIAAGLSLNSGKLLTIDSYVEENVQRQNVKDNVFVNEINTDGYEKTKKLIDLFELNNIHQLAGWSPVDCIEHLKTFGKIDFVFLDCPKCDDDLERDLSYLPQFLDNRYIIFIHDSHTFTEKADKIVFDILGKPLEKINKFDGPDGIVIQNYPLAMVNGL